jgi:predicted nuclease of predicted toxin-antitoxin system
LKRVLLDQGLAPRTAELLRADGWEATHVAEVHLHSATDSAILEFAYRGNWTCVTLDHDFHWHLAQNRASGPSVVFLRIEGLGAELQAKLIRKIWDLCEAGIEKGAAVSADVNSVRLRYLPLRPSS